MEEAAGGGGTAAAAMNVLVAVDESDESLYSLQWALDKILKTAPPTDEGGEQESSKVITIVNVVEPLPRYAFPSVASQAVVESVRKTQEQNAAKILSRAFDMCRDSSLKAKTLILEGDPKDKICSAVEEMNINLLVMGSRGLGQIKRAFLGSVSDYCAQHAKCPVLVVKPPPKKTTS